MSVWSATGLLVLGLVLLVAGAEATVRAASVLARRLGVSTLVIGLTVVAFGTSLPELIVCLLAAWHDSPALVLGNANIVKLRVILGMNAWATPLPVEVRFLRVDLPVSAAFALAALALGWGGRLGRAGGLSLLAAYGLYVVQIAA